MFTAGYKAVLHIHSLVEECEIIRLLAAMDMKTRPPTRRKVSFIRIKRFVKVKGGFCLGWKPETALSVTVQFDMT